VENPAGLHDFRIGYFIIYIESVPPHGDQPCRDGEPQGAAIHWLWGV